MRLVLSLLFSAVIYLLMAVYGILGIPVALVSPAGANAVCRAWANTVKFLARVMLGLKTEVRGTPPTGEVLIAAKHQSFLDILIIFAALPRAKFIMKRELMWTPIIGLYAMRAGCVPVNRGKRGEAIRKMLADVKSGKDLPGQVVIYPQGHRIAPGVSAPYKAGAAALYAELGQPCVPVACNVGLFWPKNGLRRRPGTAVVEFLPAIPPGLAPAELMAKIEPLIEGESNRLMAEAGFHGDGKGDGRGAD